MAPPYKSNYRRRKMQAFERRQTKPQPKEEKPPITIGMILRIAFMIITAGLFSKN